MPMHLGAPTHRHVQQKARLTRKGIGLDRLLLNQARIPKRSFLAGGTPIHQRDLEATLLQMQGGAGADHARAQNKDGGSHVCSIERAKGCRGLSSGWRFALFKLWA